MARLRHLTRVSDQSLHEALGLTGTRSEETVHVGDSYEDDIKGANAAGIRAVLIDRHGHHDGLDGMVKPAHKIRNLTELIC